MEVSGFDDVVLSTRDDIEDLPIALAIARGIGAPGSSQVAIETVFTSGDEHPFDDLIVPGLTNLGVTSLASHRVLQFSDLDGHFAFVAFTTKFRGVFHIASGQPRTSGRWDKFERALASSGDVSRVYLNHADFRSITSRLERYSDVSVSRATARKRVDYSSISRGFPDTGVGTRPTPAQAISEMESQGAVLRTLTMQTGQLSLQLRRVAGATFYAGDPRLFVSEVLGPMATAAAKRGQLLSGRARRQALDALRPLTIDLDTPLFQSREDTGLLVDAVASLPNTSSAVLHRNPYLHVVVRDESDGSNFDVVVTEADAVRVYPGYRASQAALGRLSLGLSERFGAQSIENVASAEPVSLADLIG